MSETADRIRVDKWLWHARFAKTRSLAAAIASSGRMRVNGAHSSKPARLVGPGDVLTFPLGRAVRVIRIEAPGLRRGPAPEAQTLYTDLDPPAPAASNPETAEGPPPSPAPEKRPDRRARREITALRRFDA